MSVHCLKVVDNSCQKHQENPYRSCTWLSIFKNSMHVPFGLEHPAYKKEKGFSLFSFFSIYPYHDWWTIIEILKKL